MKSDAKTMKRLRVFGLYRHPRDRDRWRLQPWFGGRSHHWGFFDSSTNAMIEFNQRVKTVWGEGGLLAYWKMKKRQSVKGRPGTIGAPEPVETTLAETLKTQTTLVDDADDLAKRLSEILKGG